MPPGQRIGNLYVDGSGCTPTSVADGLGTVLGCAGTISNATDGWLPVTIQAIDQGGNTVGSQQESSLAPGGQMQLDAPSSGQSWLIIAITPGQAADWGWLFLIGASAVGTLAAYGLWEMGKHALSYIRRHHPGRR